MASERLALFVAEDEDSVVGYVNCEPPHEEDVGQVSIYVSPDYWGRVSGRNCLSGRSRISTPRRPRPCRTSCSRPTTSAKHSTGNFERASETTVELSDEEFDANIYRAQL